MKDTPDRGAVWAVFYQLRRMGLAPLIISAVIAWANALSLGFLNDGGWGKPGLVDIAYGFVLWAIIYCALLFILFLTERFSIVESSSSQALSQAGEPTDVSSASGFFHLFNRKTLIRTLIIFICWLPITIAFFPGIPFHDTLFQLAQFFGNPAYGNFSMHAGASFTDHHPIFTTFIFGGIVNLGYMLTGNSTVGLFLLTLIQVIITAFTFAFSCSYLQFIGVKRGAARFLLAVYAVFPLFPLIANCVVKDTFFSWLYLWFLIFIIEFVRTRGGFFKSKRAAVIFVFICLLLALTKKTGVYLVVITALVFLIVYRKAILAWIASVLLPIIAIFIIMPYIIFPAFNVSPGSPVEMLGIFYQQTARYVIDNPDGVTPEEQQIINEMIGFDTISDRYQIANIDPLKGYGYLDGVNYWPSGGQILSYLKCYLAEGIRNPRSYIKALFTLNSNWLTYGNIGDGDMTIFDWSITSADQAAAWPDNVPHYDRPAFISSLAYGVANIDKMVAHVPVVSIAFSPVFYVFLIPMLCLLLLIKSRKRFLGIFVPVFLSFLFLLISPVSGTWYEPIRYVIPFIYTSPVLIVSSLFIFQKYSKRNQ